MALPPEDYAEILNLYARYNACSDDGDTDGYAACFTTDGELEAGELFVRGRGDLAAYKREEAGRRGGRYRRHWNGSIVLDQVDESTVHGRCYLHAYNGTPGSLPELATTGVYADVVARTADGWRFARRHLTKD
jgi:hypothetical protein